MGKGAVPTSPLGSATDLQGLAQNGGRASLGKRGEVQAVRQCHVGEGRPEAFGDPEMQVLRGPQLVPEKSSLGLS